MDHKQSYTANKLSHAYIVTGNGEDALEQAGELAAAMMCRFPEQAPCGHCENCRKIREGIHPDLGHVTREVENGKQKKSILVRQIRALIADAYVMPNEADRKVYIIEDADTMNLQAQNAILKLLGLPKTWKKDRIYRRSLKLISSSEKPDISDAASAADAAAASAFLDSSASSFRAKASLSSKVTTGFASSKRLSVGFRSLPAPVPCCFITAKSVAIALSPKAWRV